MPKSQRTLLLNKAKAAWNRFKAADKQKKQRKLKYEASAVVAQVQAPT